MHVLQCVHLLFPGPLIVVARFGVSDRTERCLVVEFGQRCLRCGRARRRRAVQGEVLAQDSQLALRPGVITCLLWDVVGARGGSGCRFALSAVLL